MLIEAARTMLIYAKALLFLWAEVVATACYTQNRSIIRLRHEKTPYELLHNKPRDLSFLHVFGALCYSTNDSENLRKLQPKADIGIFIGYAPTKKAFQIYNRCTKRIIETIHVDFDKLTAMDSEHSSSEPALYEMTPTTISSGLVPNHPPSTFVDFPTPKVIAPSAKVVAPKPAASTDSPSSTTVDQDATSPSNSQTTPETQTYVISNDVEEDNHDLDVRRMIATPGEPDLPVPVPESFHEQIDEELIETDIKLMDAGDQAMQTILLGLPKDVYAAVDSCETAKEIWERVRQMMKGSDIGKQEKRQRSSMNGESSRLLTRNRSNLIIIGSFHQTKNLHEADFTQIYAFLKMNQNEQGYNAWQNSGIQGAQSVVQNAGGQNGGNQSGLVVVLWIANQSRTSNVVAARAEGTGMGNQARFYNCRGLGHIARNCTARPRRRDATYLQTQLLIAQKEEAVI
nr:retrovirus-related Pol polyprotein from transposon TNT 1-94 [Tanacetum cinerariifolium]